MRLTLRPRAWIYALGLFLALSGAVHAQNDWPNKPVRIIASFAPGGSSDLVARQLAQHLSTRYGQQFIVENRAGAGGNIGVDAVAKAAPDGYTRGLATSGPLANNKSLYNAMPFDPDKDLAPVALVGEIPLVLAINPTLKIGNLKELVALSKRPDALSVAHPGNGTIGHLAAEQLRIGNGANLRSIPYRGRPLARPAATRVHATHGPRRQRVAGAHPCGPQSGLVPREPGTGRRIDLDRGTVERPRRADHRRTQHQRPGQPHQRQGDASAVAARAAAGVAVDLAHAGVATWMSSGAAAGCG